MEDIDYGRMILPDGKYYSLDDRKTRLNNNVLVVGTTGSSKTRTVITPNLLECTGSYVVTDPKGNLYKKWGGYMRRHGYRVVRVSFLHPERSAHYNPFHYVHTTQEIQKLAHALVYMNGPSLPDPFWDQTSLMLLNSLIAYLKESQKELDQTFENLLRLMRDGERDGYDGKSSGLGRIMAKHALMHPDSWAVKQFKSVNLSTDKTFSSILISTSSKLGAFDTEELCRMTQYDDIDLPSIGQRKTAVFVEVSDTDRSMDTFINIFFTQMMNELITYADEHCENNELPVPVRFFMDDFATNCRIDNFENMISNIRSRKISAILVVQSLSQLEAGYGESAHTIADDCDTLIYMGGNDPDTAEQIAVRVNRTADTILHMPLSTSWIIRRGERPFACQNFELDDYLRLKETLEKAVELATNKKIAV